MKEYILFTVLAGIILKVLESILMPMFNKMTEFFKMLINRKIKKQKGK